MFGLILVAAQPRRALRGELVFRQMMQTICASRRNL